MECSGRGRLDPAPCTLSGCRDISQRQRGLERHRRFTPSPPLFFSLISTPTSQGRPFHGLANALQLARRQRRTSRLDRGDNWTLWPQVPRNAAWSFAISNFTCFSIASATRLALVLSESAIISPSTVGTICQRTPYLSMIQPHAC